jgi:hypothetical protein
MNENTSKEIRIVDFLSFVIFNDGEQEREKLKDKIEIKLNAKCRKILRIASYLSFPYQNLKVKMEPCNSTRSTSQTRLT